MWHSSKPFRIVTAKDFPVVELRAMNWTNYSQILYSCLTFYVPDTQAKFFVWRNTACFVSNHWKTFGSIHILSYFSFYDFIRGLNNLILNVAAYVGCIFTSTLKMFIKWFITGFNTHPQQGPKMTFIMFRGTFRIELAMVCVCTKRYALSATQKLLLLELLCPCSLVLATLLLYQSANQSSEHFQVTLLKNRPVYHMLLCGMELIYGVQSDRELFSSC